ncbi:Flp family type IVb pilin [Duganella radicis]|uniref:Flp family type IVb pilin n=1 Tax=Duganella radicis TaxID=551988 RepID=A0A6L6PJV5_9BURK|nr:Flp family type IVb pilin [Duganella radicis]MTV38901.1 Flp family type IVb pilin [Duganella radicis]
MNAIIAAVKEFGREEDGITAIEYGLIAATMVAVVVGAFAVLGPAISTAFSGIAASITAAT